MGYYVNQLLDCLDCYQSLMRQGCLGEDHKEHIEKLKLKNIGNQYNSKPIVQIDNNDLIIGVYDSALQASNKLGIDNSSIVKCCKGKRNSVGGFKWKYLEELKKAG